MSSSLATPTTSAAIYSGGLERGQFAATLMLSASTSASSTPSPLSSPASITSSIVPVVNTVSGQFPPLQPAALSPNRPSSAHVLQPTVRTPRLMLSTITSALLSSSSAANSTNVSGALALNAAFPARPSLAHLDLSKSRPPFSHSPSGSAFSSAGLSPQSSTPSQTSALTSSSTRSTLTSSPIPHYAQLKQLVGGGAINNGQGTTNIGGLQPVNNGIGHVNNNPNLEILPGLEVDSSSDADDCDSLNSDRSTNSTSNSTSNGRQSRSIFRLQRHNVNTLPVVAEKVKLEEMSTEQEKVEEQQSDNESQSEAEDEDDQIATSDGEEQEDEQQNEDHAHSDNEHDHADAMSDIERTEDPERSYSSSGREIEWSLEKEDKSGDADGFEYDLAKNERVERTKASHGPQQRGNRKRKANDLKRASCHRCQTKPRAGIQLFECRHLRQKPTRGKPSTSSRSPLSSSMPKSACCFLFCTEERCLKGISTKLGLNFKTADDMRKYFESGQPCPHCLGLELCENSNCTSRLKKLVSGGKYELKYGVNGKSSGPLSRADTTEKVKKEKIKNIRSKKVQSYTVEADREDDDINLRPKKLVKKSVKQQRKTYKKTRKSPPVSTYMATAITNVDADSSLMDEVEERTEPTKHSKRKSKERKSKSPIRKVSASSLSPCLSFTTSSSHSSPPPLDANSPTLSPSSLPSSPVPASLDVATPQQYLTMAPATSSTFSTHIMPTALPITHRSSTVPMAQSGAAFSLSQSAPVMFMDGRRSFDQLQSQVHAHGHATNSLVNQDFMKSASFMHAAFNHRQPHFPAMHASAIYQPSTNHPLVHAQQPMALPYHHPAAAAYFSGNGGHYPSQVYNAFTFPLQQGGSVAPQQNNSGSISPLHQQTQKYLPIKMEDPRFAAGMHAHYLASGMQFTPTNAHPNAPTMVRAMS